MIRILLVDDDSKIRDMVTEYSQAESWFFDKAANGIEALRLMEKHSYNLIILDVMMPGLDGWGTLRRVRQDSDIPVIMLTARDEEYDRLLGFELGADDYIGKPFSPRELIARIKALLKRSGAYDTVREVIEARSLFIDTSARQVKLADNTLTLTPREYDLLAFMAARPGQAFTRDQLLNHVWGIDYVGDARTVDSHIKSLREKLGPERELIATVWGTGYRFEGGKNR